MNVDLRCLAQRLVAIGAAVLFVILGSAAHAQLRDPEAEPWQETEVAPPVAFSTEDLQPFEVSQHAALAYGIDPKTLAVGQDDVVRYVLVARSSSGALNVLYQGVRCATAEVKTYGRWNNNTASWNVNSKEEWQALSFSGFTRPAMMLARAGVCDGRTVNGTPQKMLNTLKHGRPEVR
jgi:hypothetical protein